jgi:hypothetical protein
MRLTICNYPTNKNTEVVSYVMAMASGSLIPPNTKGSARTDAVPIAVDRSTANTIKARNVTLGLGMMTGDYEILNSQNDFLGRMFTALSYWMDANGQTFIFLERCNL